MGTNKNKIFITQTMSPSGRALLHERDDIELVEFPNLISAADFEALLKAHAPVHGVALGATRWEVVRTIVLPFGRSGYVSGAMLGLGRALGETVALLIIVRGTQTAFGWSLFDGGSTFATKIAAAASEFDDKYEAGAYMAAGLMLFVLTFLVDAAARGAVTGAGSRRGNR